MGSEKILWLYVIIAIAFVRWKMKGSLDNAPELRKPLAAALSLLKPWFHPRIRTWWFGSIPILEISTHPIPNPLLPNKRVFFCCSISHGRDKTNEAATRVNGIMIKRTIGFKLKSGENHLDHNMVKNDDRVQTKIEQNQWNRHTMNEAKMHFRVT